MAQEVSKRSNSKVPTVQPVQEAPIDPHAHDLGVEILDDTKGWLQHNMNALLGVVGAIVLVVMAYVGYHAWQSSQNEEAQKEMFAAVYQFEADSLKKALNGDGNMIGLQAIADDYSGTPSGKLADFYIGTIYLKQGKFDQAIEALEKFSSDDILVQARAYALLGDAYSEKNAYDDAAKNYLKAANHRPNKFFTPAYLMKLAVVQETQKDYKGAKETYDRIVKEYYESQEATDARKFRARAEEMSAGS